MPLLRTKDRSGESERGQFSRLGEAEDATQKTAVREVEDFGDIRPLIRESSFLSQLTDQL